MAGPVKYQGKPSWIRQKVPGGEIYNFIDNIVKEKKLHTVCKSAGCPNLAECWSGGTASLMILGEICTRGCRFCEVAKGRPVSYDKDEPYRVAESIRMMKLRHVVITSVARDDLEDQGAQLWAETIREVRREAPECNIEVLIPDLQGRPDLLDVILDANPDILGHNFETVERLQKKIRGKANLRDSSLVLRHAKSRGFVVKTGIMLGLGERQPEIEEMILYCARLQVDILTIGQYLQPNKKLLPVIEMITPEMFNYYKKFALGHGIRVCESSPMQRSSFRAEQSAFLIKGHL